MIKEALHIAKGIYTKHGTKIMTGVGAVGLVITVGLAIEATVKAVKDVEEEKEKRFVEQENNEDKLAGTDYIYESRDEVVIPKKEILKLVWRRYIKTVAMGSVSIACIIGAEIQNERIKNSLLAAYCVAEASLDSHKEAISEVLREDENLDVDINKKAAENLAAKNPAGYSAIIEGQGDILCQEAYTGRWFRTTSARFNMYQAKINELLVNRNYVSLNDFYGILGVPQTSYGHDVGWSAYGNEPTEFIHFREFRDQSTGLEPYILIDFIEEPKPEYMMY